MCDPYVIVPVFFCIKKLSSWLNLRVAADVPEGCVIVKEHIPITNLFTCLWFNEVDRFTSRDQLSFAIVRDKIMSKVDWQISMFLDCERRNFVLQVTVHAQFNDFSFIWISNECGVAINPCIVLGKLERKWTE